MRFRIVATKDYFGIRPIGRRGASHTTRQKLSARTEDLEMLVAHETGPLMRSRVCTVCEGQFSYPIGRGNDRQHCSPECRQKQQLRLREERIPFLPLCSTEGCNKPANRVGAGQCEKCYCRQRNTGSAYTPRRTFKYRYTDSAGYVKLQLPAHPLADVGGGIREHRAVLYDLLGEGPHPCHWCASILEWPAIVVDHLNEDKADNRPKNLVCSCSPCNRARGAILPFLARITDAGLFAFVDAAIEYRDSLSAAVQSKQNDL